MSVTLETVKMKISGKDRKVACVGFDLVAKSSQPKSIHYVDILDRSGSMYYEINKVIDHTQERIKMMRKDDYITVIWFSSQGMYEVFVKGAKPEDGVIKQLDKLRSVKSLTCFSDAIKAAVKCVEDLKGIADESILTLLTDGHPVTNDNTAEIYKCKSIITSARNDIMAFNTVGFGNYYNRDFLLELSSLTCFGGLRHINDMDQYNNVYLEMVTPLTGMCRDTVDIESQGSEIIYIGGQIGSGNCMVSKADNYMSLLGISKEGNTIFIIDPHPEFKVIVNDTEILKGMKNAVTGSAKDKKYTAFLYAYASYLYNEKNKREVALDIIAKNISDRAVAELLVNAFTYDEVGEFNALLNDCIVDDTSWRSEGFCPPNFVPKFDAYCVFDLLNDLNNGDAMYVPFPQNNSLVKEYTRITRKTTDDQDIFVAEDRSNVISPISSLVYAEDKLNVSIKFEIPGTVTLNKKAADRVDLEQVQKAKIFRNHTIIKDGNLNMPAIVVVMSDELHKEINSKLEGKSKALIYSGDINPDNTITVTLNLKKLPIINRSYLAKANADDISRMTVGINTCEVEQKVLGYILDKVSSKFPSAQKVGEFKALTVDQIQVLKDHGLSATRVYSGINPQTPKTDESDYYEYRKIATYVGGVSSIPAVEGSLTKQKKTFAELMVSDCFNRLCTQFGPVVDKPTKEFVQELNDQITSIRRRLMGIRNEMSGIKLSVVLNNSWFQGVTLNEKGVADLPDGVKMTVKYAKEYY